MADTQYRHSALLTARAARALGKTEDAARYEALAENLLADIRAEYFTPAGRCAVPTQTGLLLALQDGNAPDPARVARDLADRLKAADGKLQTGFVGTPLLAPGLMSTSLFGFITAWNEFPLVLIVNKEQGKTLPLWLSSFKTAFGNDWGATMAASTMFAIPVLILFVFLQRKAVGGLTDGAVKG